jgi:hypothetical protein
MPFSLHHAMMGGDMMMMRYGLGALAMAMGLGAAPVRADVIKIFQANGLFEDGVKLGGTLTIDVTTGVVTAADLLLSEPVSAEVTGLAGTGGTIGGFAQQFFTPGPGGPLPVITLLFTTPSLVDYGGGLLASDMTLQDGFASDYFPPDGGQAVILASGAFTTGTLTVPEPSTWAMMLIGFAGYRASRRMAAAAT